LNDLNSEERIKAETEIAKEDILKELSDQVLKWLNSEIEIADLLRYLSYHKSRWEVLGHQ